MQFWLETMRASLEKGEFENAELREALPQLAQLHLEIIMKIFSARSTAADLAAVVENGSPSFALQAATAILEMPKERITVEALRVVVRNVPERTDAAARRLLAMGHRRGGATLEVLGEIVSHARTEVFARTAGEKILAHPEATDADISLVALYVSALAAAAYARLGSLPPEPTLTVRA